MNGACGGASLHSVVPATAEQQVRVLGVELKREDTVGVPRLGLAPATAAAAHPCAFVARCLCPASWPGHRSRSTTNAESREVVARSSGGRGSQYHSVCVCVLVASSYTRTCTCAAGANEPKTEGNNRIRSRTAVSASRLSSKLLWESAVSGHLRPPALQQQCHCALTIVAAVAACCRARRRKEDERSGGPCSPCHPLRT